MGALEHTTCGNCEGDERSRGKRPAADGCCVWCIHNHVLHYRVSKFRAYVTVLSVRCTMLLDQIQESNPNPDWISGWSHATLDKLLFLIDPRSKETSSSAILLQDGFTLALITWLSFIGSPRTGVASKNVEDNLKFRVAADARLLRQRFALLIAHIHETPSEDPQHLTDRLFVWIADLGSVASVFTEKIQFFPEHARTPVEKLDVDSWASFTCI